jgi:hypothetical protein
MAARHAGDDIDALYGVLPVDFVRARNALAAKFREGGRRSEAAAVGKLRRPTPVVWAVNQVARQERDAVTALLQAADRLKGRRLIQPHDARAALDGQRAALERVAGHARQRLKTIGVGTTAAIERRMSGTLLGALSDADTREALRAGRLTTELEAPGFEVLGGTVARLVPARPGAPRERATSDTGRLASEKTPPIPIRRGASKRTREDAVREHADRSAAQREAVAARERVAALSRRAEQLEQEAAAQARRAEEATAAARDFRLRAKEATAAAGEARRAARAASAAARKARQQ